ncbi:hypothetical protein A0257_11910 [Hymenobacter psoromatis]|nr:hypothetical protein A0257_11910 [Hymenobacter psoromatis]
MRRVFLLWTFLLAGRASWAQTAEAVPPPTPARHAYCLLGPTVLFADDGRTYFGVDFGVGGLVSRRLAIGGTLSISGRRNIATNYGYQATAPEVGLYSLQASTRLMLADAAFCRLELLNGIGYGAACLFDRDRTVQTTTRTSTGGTITNSQPLRVALSEHLLLEAGLSLTFKLWRGPWLTTQFSRRQFMGSSEFGGPNGFSHWIGTIGVSLPNGW